MNRLTSCFAEWNYGVLQAHGNKTEQTYSPKPAYTAAVVLQKHIRGREFVRRHPAWSVQVQVHGKDGELLQQGVPPVGNNSIFVLEFAGGVFVVWTNSSVTNATVLVPGESNDCYIQESMLGEQEGLLYGGQTTTVGDSPLYLRRQVAPSAVPMKHDDSSGGGSITSSSGTIPSTSCVFATHDWNALRTLKSVSATTPAECCARCAATSSCEAGILDAAGQCYLKAGLQSTTGCSNCTSCTLPGNSSVASLEFGPARFRLRLNPATNGLQNISVSSQNGAFTQQGFLMNEMAPPKRSEYSLWRLNVTDCRTVLPEGTKVTRCIGTDCSSASHSISADGRTLTLRWAGVPLPAKFMGVRLDVTVTVAQLPGGKPGVSLSGAVSLSLSVGRKGQVCLQNMALPTLDGIQMRSEETDTMFIPGKPLCTRSPLWLPSLCVSDSERVPEIEWALAELAREHSAIYCARYGTDA